MRIRDFSGGDFETVARLMGITWHAKHGKKSYWQGADELCAYLHKTDKGYVADDDGEFLGAILLRSASDADRNSTMSMHWLQQRTRIAAMASALGIDARCDAQVILEESELMKSVAGDLGSDGVGEIVLLIVGADARGRGVGTKLLEAGETWLRAHGATSVRLVTDTDCDWQYYEHLGFACVRQATSEACPSLNQFVHQKQL